MTPPSAPATVDSPTPTVPTAAARIADYVVMTLAVVLGVGSIALFAWAGRPRVRLPLPDEAALWWNALVSCVFFLQHSVLVRRPVRARLSKFLPARYDAACYAITSGIALALVAVLMQPDGRPLYVLEGLAAMVVRAAAFLAVAGMAWGFFALKGFDLLGLRPIRRHLRGDVGAASTAAPEAMLTVRGPYRWVRHPLYSCLIVIFWAEPSMAASRLITNAAWTAWMVLGARLEEHDLRADFGEQYDRYREQVPFLIPWRRPAPERG